MCGAVVSKIEGRQVIGAAAPVQSKVDKWLDERAASGRHFEAGTCRMHPRPARQCDSGSGIPGRCDDVEQPASQPAWLAARTARW